MGKKIILCFDGTGNEPEDSRQEVGLTGDVEDGSITNVLKLHLLLGGDCRTRVEPAEQMSFYYAGVGTYGDWLQRLRNMLRAPAREDVGSIIRRGIRDLYTHYREGDEVFLFGFSRGAAIARRFAAVLQQTWPALDAGEAPRIRFLGVFDTVAAINRPNLLQEDVRPASDVVLENRHLSPLVQEALHIVSLDERRIPFKPTLMNREPERVTEIWFPGAHSDIGGGFHYDGLSDLTLDFMLAELQRRELGLRLTAPAEIAYDDLFDDDAAGQLTYRDVIVQPSPLGRSHEQEAITAIKEAFLDRRTPCVVINDKQSVHPPLIHHSVFERMADDPAYEPEALVKNMLNTYSGTVVPFQVWYAPGDIVEYNTPHDAELQAQREPIALAPQESRRFWVYANQKYSPTRVLVEEEGRYTFAFDETQLWFDGKVAANALGWTKQGEASLAWYQDLFIPLFEGDRREPGARWFEVIGTVGRSDEQLVRLPEHRETPWQPSRSGELFAFANDMPSKYGNNLGTVQVTITRTA